MVLGAPILEIFELVGEVLALSLMESEVCQESFLFCAEHVNISALFVDENFVSTNLSCQDLNFLDIGT